MVLNQDKYNFLFSGRIYEKLFVNVGETKIWESKQLKLLGILIDSDFKFDEYVFSLCKKAGKNLTTLIMTFVQLGTS